MSKIIAGESVEIFLDGHVLTIKVEDGSKSESIQGKVETSNSPDHQVGQVYEFDRRLLKTSS